MGKKNFLVFAVLLSICVLFWSPRASALESFSEAYIYWNTLSFSGISIDWQYQSTGVGAYAYEYVNGSSESGDQDSSNWTTELSVDPFVQGQWGRAGGEASATDDSLYEGVIVELTSADAAWALAGSGRWGEFSATEGGDLDISVDYLIKTKLTTDHPGEYAGGYSEAGLYLENYESYKEAEDWNEIYQEVYDGDDFDEYITGTLTVSLNFNQGDTGYFEVGVFNEGYGAYSAIPEPSTMILLGIGLVGLGVFGRKKLGNKVS